jgi:spectinomycin phosphotransferase
MLERPSLADEKITACLQAEYGLLATEIVFLPLGADMNTAVFRVDTDTADYAPYFLKLRRGHFDAITVDVPKFLFEQGISQIIAPITTRSGQLSARLDVFNAILYPFIEGTNGFEETLSDEDWVAFGRALKAIHTTKLPAELADRIPHKTYSPQWREMVKQF